MRNETHTHTHRPFFFLVNSPSVRTSLYGLTQVAKQTGETFVLIILSVLWFSWVAVILFSKVKTVRKN